MASHVRIKPAAIVGARLRHWHNDYAAALLDLRNALQQESDDRRRQQLLDEVRRLIGSHRAGSGSDLPARRAAPTGQ